MSFGLSSFCSSLRSESKCTVFANQRKMVRNALILRSKSKLNSFFHSMEIESVYFTTNSIVPNWKAAIIQLFRNVTKRYVCFCLWIAHRKEVTQAHFSFHSEKKENRWNKTRNDIANLSLWTKDKFDDAPLTPRTLIQIESHCRNFNYLITNEMNS